MHATGYMGGLGNEFATEAVGGALPIGRNSPQRTPFGLYAEQFSGTAFTAPRNENRRSWLYRMRPSAGHRPFGRYDGARAIRSGPFDREGSTPNRLRWDPFPLPDAPTDLIDGIVTLCGNGDAGEGIGSAVHVYAANRSMERVFFDADGELLFVPQHGMHTFVTEFGRLDAGPGTIVVIPRGVRFRLDTADGSVRGYLCENYGAPFLLPELGPIGANALANPRDFETPVAAFEDVDGQVDCIQKYDGALWATTLDHSPFDVVAWHGNHAPYRYDLSRFCPVGAVSFDHPDPSIYTVLTSPSELPGVANADFVIFPPRWLVAEDTFRPPWFHRNVMSEFMGLIYGSYDSKEGGGFVPGGSSLHNTMQAHGPDLDAYAKAVDAVLEPRRIDGSIAFMFESRWPYRPTPGALAAPERQRDYDECWQGFPKARLPQGGEA